LTDNASLLKRIKQGDELPRVAAQPVQFPHRQAVACLESGKAFGEGRALVQQAGNALVLEDGFASRLFERGNL